MIPAVEAIQRLRAGNERFVLRQLTHEVLLGRAHSPEHADGQNPFAIVLGCSDSRAPAELVFDQGLGDLFVIRVAGNIVAPSQVGSVEFAAARFNTRLVVVLGHTKCGAVEATLEVMRGTATAESRNLQSIVDRIRPSMEALMQTDLRNDPVELMRQAVRANVRASVNQLKHGSDILEGLIARHGLLVVGAEYSLGTGRVDFFDGLPDES
ncbi:MAG TPA: carbonic anhydrase [Candidatus Eisenbacteria bacterium]